MHGTKQKKKDCRCPGRTVFLFDDDGSTCEPEEPLRSENQGKKEEEEVGGVGEEDLGDDFFILLLAEHLNPFKISHFFTVAA